MQCPSSANVQRINAVLPHWTNRNVVTLNLVTKLNLLCEHFELSNLSKTLQS
jgi:hypothetical protein